MNDSKSLKNGFTLVELLISIAILSVLLLVSVGVFFNTRDVHILEKETQAVAKLLEEARSLTVASKNDTFYGIYIDTITNTVGITIGGDINNFYKKTTIEDRITVSEIDGTSPSTNFERLTGKATGYGNIIISLTSDPTQIRTISIYETGLIEVQ